MKRFTKDDLKVGMLLVYKNGYKVVVMPKQEDENGDTLYLMGKVTVLPLERLDEQEQLSKVYGIQKYGLPIGNLHTTEGRELIWQETKQVTIDEIEKALGYKIQIVNN